MVTAVRLNFVKPLVISFILISVFLLASNVSAKEATSSSNSGSSRKEAIEKKAEERKALIEAKREEKKEKIETRIEDRKEKMASREAALKAKLEAFKNKEKAIAVEKINNSLKSINQKMVLHFTNVLERISAILAKLESRVNSSTPDIKDTVMAKQAIDDAKLAINAAKEAVTSQSGKDYTVSVTSEGKVKTDVQKVRDQLHTDLKSLKTVVNTARDAVSKAIRISKSGKIEAKEATESGQ